MPSPAQRVIERYANTRQQWVERAEYHEREIQAIKRRLKQYFGGVFDEYLGEGADQANKLRKSLELHRVAWTAAREQREPTPHELQYSLRHLGKAVRDARV